MNKKLYRYRGNINSEEHFLGTGHIYIPTFHELNDPYDGLINLSVVSHNDVFQTLVKTISNNFKEWTREQCEFRANQLLKGQTLQDFEMQINGIAATEFREQWKVLSFSKDACNELMWAHYGAQHRGICLEFNPDADPLLSTCQDVIYSSGPPTARFPSNDGSMLEAVLSKSKVWEYESECRAIVPDIQSQIQKINAEALIGVIFGLSMSSEDKAKIKRWMSNGPFKPKFFNARLKKGCYLIEVVPENIRPIGS